jgi:hypothetical protein
MNIFVSLRPWFFFVFQEMKRGVSHERLKYMLESIPLDLLGAAFSMRPKEVTVEELYHLLESVDDDVLVPIQCLCNFVMRKKKDAGFTEDKVYPNFTPLTPADVVAKHCPRDFVLKVLGHEKNADMPEHTYQSLLRHTNVHSLAVLMRCWEMLGPKQELGPDGEVTDRLIVDFARYAENRVELRAFGPPLKEQIRLAALPK